MGKMEYPEGTPIQLDCPQYIPGEVGDIFLLHGWKGEVVKVEGSTRCIWLGRRNGMQETAVVDVEWLRKHSRIIERSPFRDKHGKLYPDYES